MIAVIDYHKGNLKSVERGLMGVGAQACITDDPREIARADALVLPGVGAFGDASTTLAQLGLTEVIRNRVRDGVAFLGICLGLHLMFEEGEEGEVETDEDEDPLRPQGLSILPGVVTHMPREDATGTTYKIPHVGWNAVTPASLSGEEEVFSSPLFKGIKPGEYFYFTHSYVAPESPATIARTTHSITFPSAVAYENRVFGVQFHPEKSSDAGARLLKNFVDIAAQV